MNADLTVRKAVQGGLFGDDVTVEIGRTPFTDEEVEEILADAPASMLTELQDSLIAMKKEVIRGDKEHAVTDAKKRFWLNLEWVYELSATPAVLSFDTACAHEGVDSDLIRSRISTGFAAQIREFIGAYASYDQTDAKRVANKLRRFINI